MQHRFFFEIIIYVSLYGLAGVHMHWQWIQIGSPRDFDSSVRMLALATAGSAMPLFLAPVYILFWSHKIRCYCRCFYHCVTSEFNLSAWVACELCLPWHYHSSKWMPENSSFFLLLRNIEPFLWQLSLYFNKKLQNAVMCKILSIIPLKFLSRYTWHYLI